VQISAPVFLPIHTNPQACTNIGRCFRRPDLLESTPEQGGCGIKFLPFWKPFRVFYLAGTTTPVNSAGSSFQE